jgi:hypothetical protein
MNSSEVSSSLESSEEVAEEAAFEDALKDELERCRLPLRDFSPLVEHRRGFARSDRPSERIPIARERLPVIASVQLVMRLLVGARRLGRAEKLAWEYPFAYRGRACSLAHEKFGLRLYLEPSSDAGCRSDGEEIVKKLSAATRMLDNGILKLAAAEETAAGHLIVWNQVPKLRGMYDYFRRLATEAYAGNGFLAKDHDERSEGSVFMQQLRVIPERTEGFYATVAMTMSFFSLLEHLLVFALLATDFDPTQESLTDFIGSRLSEKFKRVFDVTGDPEAKRYYQKLHEAAETWRNPYGHGGFDKRHGTLAFFMPGIGPFPLLLSDIRKHPSFSVVPEREQSFDELCTLFDDLGRWLRTGIVAPGIAWAEAALDIAFTEAFLGQFRQALAEGPAAFEDYLMTTSYRDDQATNMDW